MRPFISVNRHCCILLTSFILMLSVFSAAHAETKPRQNGCILYGAKHVYSVSAIDGWIADSVSGARQGLNMVFYPEGSTWNDSDVIIYGRSIENVHASSIEKQVESTVKKFVSEGSPDHASSRQPSVELPNGREAAVYYFTGDKWGNYEAVMYIQEHNTINYLVFNARKKEDFEKYLADFHRIGKTYENLYDMSAVLSPEESARFKSEFWLYKELENGADYFEKAYADNAEHIASALRSCIPFDSGEGIPQFMYYSNINNDGSVADTFIFPGSDVALCFNGLMSGALYPPHTYDHFMFGVPVIAGVPLIPQ